MTRIKTSLIAGAAAMTIAAPAGAADMPPPMICKAPVAVQTSGWYLRGDIGFSNQRVEEMTSRDVEAGVAGLLLVEEAVDDAGVELSRGRSGPTRRGV